MKIAVLHEGHANKSEDNWLIKAIIQNELKLDINLFAFYGVGYKSNFFTFQSRVYKEILPLIEAQALNKVLFIIDADYQENDAIYGGYNNTLKQWQNITHQLNIRLISTLYITCHPVTKVGYLESLLLASLDEVKTKCIQDFISCSDFKAKDNHKAILNQIYKTAYPNSPYDLKHKCFDELKALINQQLN